jgi:signal transduction histidine kinase
MDNVQIAVNFDTPLPMISCEENQLKQVFLNLLKNAIEAMPDVGIIDVNIKENEEGNMAIAIIDQGKGIPAERIATLGSLFILRRKKGQDWG